MEDDAQFAAATAKRKMDKKDSEANKKAYYEALAKYEFISKELGDQSPAKLAEKARKVKAAATAALQELAASLTRAKNVKDVLAAIGKASKNTSVLPTLLKEARTDATMKKVLGIVAEDEKMAKLLAEELLKATSEDMVADAFAEVAEQAVSQGTNDPEVIMRAKLDALVGKYVMQGEIGMAKIKDTFNNAAEQASTPEALDAALTFAAQSAEAKMGEIDAALVEAVAPLAGAYDLTDARATIGVALGAGRAEVRLNHARMAARLQAKDFDRQLNEGLQQADTAAGVLELLEQARAFTADAEDNLAAQLDEILAEARDTPGLEERIPEAEAYVETIKAEQGAAFSDAGAGAELAASGAEARVAIASIKSRLQRDLAEAKTAEEVDSILNEAESDAMALTNRMNGNIDDVISTHNLASPEGAKKSDAEVLAGDLRKAVAKDIDNIRGKAIAFADERKAGLEKDAANAAQALFEATAARAAAAGASMAKLQAQLKYYQGQAMSAATDADKAAADLQVVSLEAQIAQLTEDQAAAQKEAARLEEANKNSQALSRLADEIAAAKSTSDGVINGLLDKQDEIHAKIDARNEAFEQMYE
jgi:hypothetical protein